MAADDANVFTDKTTDLRPPNSAIDAAKFRISPEYFRAAGTAILFGKSVHLG